MAKNVKFEHSSAGYVRLMCSDEMADVLREHSGQVVSSARANLSMDRTNQENEPYYEHEVMRKDRLGVIIVTGNPHSMKAELKYGPLQNAAGV